MSVQPMRVAVDFSSHSHESEPASVPTPLMLQFAAFEELDEDDSGKIDTGEVKRGLESVGMVSSASSQCAFAPAS